MKSFRLFGNADRHIAARDSEAQHTTENGVYRISELAYVEKLGDKAFVSAVGLATRRDPMSDEERKAIDGQAAARKLAAVKKQAAELKVEDAQFHTDLMAATAAGKTYDEYIEDQIKAQEARIVLEAAMEKQESA